MCQPLIHVVTRSFPFRHQQPPGAIGVVQPRTCTRRRTPWDTSRRVTFRSTWARTRTTHDQLYKSCSRQSRTVTETETAVWQQQPEADVSKLWGRRSNNCGIYKWRLRGKDAAQDTFWADWLGDATSRRRQWQSPLVLRLFELCWLREDVFRVLCSSIVGGPGREVIMVIFRHGSWLRGPHE